jgi:hypothetical protein
MAVKVGRAIVPPDRATFAERHLGLMNRFMRDCLGYMIGRAPGRADGTAGVHQFLHQALTLVRL